MLLRTDGRGWSTVAATGSTAAHIDQVQHIPAEGPAVEAITAGRPVQVPDWTPDDLRWPVFAAALGPDADTLRALFALLLDIDGVVRGVLRLYRAAPGTIDPDRLATAWLTAETVGTALATAPRD